MRKLKLKELNRLTVDEYHDVEKTPLVVVIDNVRSALNIGSIFRTVDAMGCEKIIICGISATPPHRDIHKSAIGATKSVTWEYETNTTDAISKLKSDGYQIFAIEQTVGSITMEEADLSEKVAIVLGNEVHGVSDDALSLSDHALEIEQFGTKHSMNVAVCAGIVIWNLSQKMRG